MRVDHRRIIIIMRFERQRAARACARRSPSQPARGKVHGCQHRACVCMQSCEPVPNGGLSFLRQRRFVARIRASCESEIPHNG